MGGSIMASTINAKNTSSGVVITPDASGQLELQTADTTRMTIDVNGNVGIGTTNPTVPLTIGGSTLPAGVTVSGQMISSETNTTDPILSARVCATNGNPVIGQFTASGTIASPTAVASGRGLGRNNWYGFDGTNYINAAAIIVSVDGTPGTNSMPGRIVFATTPSGSSTVLERMRITSNGGISFGSSGTAFGTSGQVLQSNGDAAPSWTTISSIGYTVVLFASSGSWTVPAGVTTAKVTVCGGGGGSSGTSTAVIGGQGGFASAYLTGLTPGSSITVTIGAGGSSGSSATAGGTTSFGSFLSATGGTAGSGSATNGTRGTGTVSSGTNLGSGSVNDGGSGTESSFLLPQYGSACFRPALSGRNAGVSWAPTLGIHPGAAGVGSGTSANRSGAVGGFVAIEY